MTRRILISFAHPDDETFGLGGLIAHYVAQGVEVHYLCATNGDVGTVSPELLNGYNSIADLRIAELNCAADLLGFKSILLGYKDSGMMGSAENQDPACLWNTWQTDPASVTRRVVETIRRIQPQVVITFNKYGGYGHPDHIAIQQATTQAFTLAADASYVTDGLAPYAAQKLYYTSISTFFIRYGLFMMRMRRQDPRKGGRNGDIDMLAILENVEPTHTRVNVRPYLDLWDKANACHHSQGGGRFFPLAKLLRSINPYQTLTRVYPKPPRDVIDEQDLFSGVREDQQVKTP